MSKIIISEITETALGIVPAVNSRLQQIEDELNDKVLYRLNPGSEPNAMSNDLDMANNDILNAKDISAKTLTLDGVIVSASGGGLDPTADEPISGVWDFENGLQGGRYTYGQPTVTPLATIPTAYSATFSNSAAGGTISLTASTSAADESSGTSLSYFNSLTEIDSSTWAVGDNIYIQNLVRDAGGSASNSYMVYEKTAIGMNRYEVSYLENGAGDSEIIHLLGDDGEATLEFNGLPIDGRILTEEVNTSRTLTKADIGKILICTGSSDITITVPVGLQDKSFNCEIVNETTSNNVTLVDDGTSVLVNKDSHSKVLLNGVARILPTLVTDRYRLDGDTQI